MKRKPFRWVPLIYPSRAMYWQLRKDFTLGSVDVVDGAFKVCGGRKTYDTLHAAADQIIKLRVDHAKRELANMLELQREFREIASIPTEAK